MKIIVASIGGHLDQPPRWFVGEKDERRTELYGHLMVKTGLDDAPVRVFRSHPDAIRYAQRFAEILRDQPDVTPWDAGIAAEAWLHETG